MEVECPCGCGRKIKRIWHQTAEHAEYLARLSQVADHLARVYSTYDPAEATDGAVRTQGIGLLPLDAQRCP